MTFMQLSGKQFQSLKNGVACKKWQIWIDRYDVHSNIGIIGEDLFFPDKFFGWKSLTEVWEEECKQLKLANEMK